MDPQQLMDLIMSRATWDLVVKGITIGVLVRWIFGLSIELHWAAIIGVVCLVAGPALSSHMGLGWPATASMNVFLSGGIVLATLGIGELVGG